jgi:hypothetical protein
MKKAYNFTYYGQAITIQQFESNVPKDWESQMQNYEFSWGGYKASERD